MVSIELSDDEALVLFEFLARREGSGSLAIQHPAEERALELVQAALERTLIVPLRPDYAELLEKARADVSRRWGAG